MEENTGGGRLGVRDLRLRGARPAHHSLLEERGVGERLRAGARDAGDRDRVDLDLGH